MRRRCRTLLLLLFCIPFGTLHAADPKPNALACATRNPARFLGRTKDLGTIETGKLADMVLLGANPLDDIHNTRKIEAVILNGKLLPKEELEKMLARLEKMSKGK